MLSVEADHVRLAVVPDKEAARLEGAEGAVVSGGAGTEIVTTFEEVEQLVAASQAFAKSAYVVDGVTEFTA